MNEQVEDYSKNPMYILKHDIYNQLSGITLALSELKYEITDPSEDCKLYLDMIASSCERINAILRDMAL